MRWWPEPTAGEIVWCHFPDNIHPKPKPRPGLIVLTKEDDEGMIFVSVAYGTSPKTDRLFSGEFRIVCVTLRLDKSSDCGRNSHRLRKIFIVLNSTP